MAKRSIGLKEFHAHASNPATRDHVSIEFKLATNAATVDDRVVSFVFSDDSIDSYNDRIDAKGWVYDRSGAGTIALFGHDPSEVANIIGRAHNVRVEGNQLIGDIHFADKDVNPDADRVLRLVQAGILNSCSVGFQPLEWTLAKDKSRPGGVDFHKQKLLEISIVGIPANENAVALQLAREAGIQIDDDWFRRASESEWKVGASTTLALDDKTEWDGPAAAERILDDAGFNGETPDSAKARKGFLVYDSANPSLKGSYKLPFADIVGGKLTAIKGGLDAAASRLPQTDIPSDVQDKAKTVLDGYEAEQKKQVPALMRAALKASGRVKKSLYDVGWLAQLLQEMGAIQDMAEWEAEWEGDDSQIPARLLAAMKTLAQILIDMTAEEVAELFADDTDLDGIGFTGLVELSAPTPAQRFVLALARVADTAGGVEKAGRVFSAANETTLRSVRAAAGTMCDDLDALLAVLEPDAEKSSVDPDHAARLRDLDLMAVPRH